MRQRWNHFKTLSRSAQALVLLRYLFPTIVALAAFLSFVPSNPWTGGMTPKPFVAIELNVTDLKGYVEPEQTVPVTATVTNPGTADGLVFIKFTYPMYTPNSSDTAVPAYTWSVDESKWAVIDSGSGYTVYGYQSKVGQDETTDSLLESVTMKKMSATEYRSLGDDVNIGMIGYIADCNEYGDDLASTWSQAGQ